MIVDKFERDDPRFKDVPHLVRGLFFYHDFNDGKGFVLARYHPYPPEFAPGIGGIVAQTAAVSTDAYVSRGAEVFGDAIVINSRINGFSRVYGRARLIRSQVFGFSKIALGSFDGCRVVDAVIETDADALMWTLAGAAS